MKIKSFTNFVEDINKNSTNKNIKEITIDQDERTALVTKEDGQTYKVYIPGYDNSGELYLNDLSDTIKNKE